MTALELSLQVREQFRDLPITQWRTNPQFAEMMRLFGELLDGAIFTPLVSIEQGLNIDDAMGFQLDWIGLRLGFPRPPSVPNLAASDINLFGFDDGDSSTTRDPRTRGFDQAPMFSYAGLSAISDAWYRRMLRGRAASILSRGTKAEIEAAGAAMGSPTTASLGVVLPSIVLRIEESEQGFYDVIVRPENLNRLFGVGAGIGVTTIRVTT